MTDYSTLSALLPNSVECFVFDSIPSTNSYLSALPFCKNTQVCITTEQTQGRGQYSRKWLSKKDSSILFSVRRVFPANTSLNGLSLAIGLALVEVLAKYGINHLKLKWPNDVYFEDKKLAGILIENCMQNDNQSVVIGIGINHYVAGGIDCQTPWIDIKQILGFELDSLVLSGDLINTILKFCNIFAQVGFQVFYSKWHKYDYLLGKTVSFKDEQNLVSGECVGINKQGLLLINTKDGIKSNRSSDYLSLLQSEFEFESGSGSGPACCQS